MKNSVFGQSEPAHGGSSTTGGGGTTQVVRAVGWSAGAQAAQHVFQFGISIALMRMLGPEVFGLIAMIFVFTGFAAFIGGMGIGSALVHRQDLTERHRSTAFWAVTFTGAALAVALCVCAPAISRFYGEPLLAPLAFGLAPAFLLGAIGGVPRVLAQRALRFDLLAKIDLAALLLSGAIAVAVATTGGGVWSLVVQHTVAATLTSTLLLCFCGWRPRLVWSPQAFVELWRYGAGVVGFNAVDYWSKAADKLLIGRFLGSSALGFYSRAHSLILQPISQISAVIVPVMFPALSRIQGDKARVSKAYLRLMGVVSFVVFPVMLGLAVVADSFILALIGSQWADVIPLIQILTGVGLIQTVCNPVGLIYTSQGRTDLLFVWGMCASGLLIGAIIVGIVFGDVQAVAVALLVGHLLIVIPSVEVPARLIGLTSWDVWRAVRGNLLCAAVMATCVATANHVLLAELPSLIQLVGQVSLGLVLYAAFVYLSGNAVLEEIAELRRHARAGRAGVASSPAGV